MCKCKQIASENLRHLTNARQCSSIFCVTEYLMTWTVDPRCEQLNVCFIHICHNDLFEIYGPNSFQSQQNDILWHNDDDDDTSCTIWCNTSRQWFPRTTMFADDAVIGTKTKRSGGLPQKREEKRSRDRGRIENEWIWETKMECWLQGGETTKGGGFWGPMVNGPERWASVCTILGRTGFRCDSQCKAITKNDRKWGRNDCQSSQVSLSKPMVLKKERSDWDGMDMYRGGTGKMTKEGRWGCNWLAGCLEKNKRGDLWVALKRTWNSKEICILLAVVTPEGGRWRSSDQHVELFKKCHSFIYFF